MNRFVIVDGLPYLLANGKTFAVRWDEHGFTVGTEIKHPSVPRRTHTERAIKAKCSACLDSIGGSETEPFEEMTVAELKVYAAEREINLGDARRKQEIIDAIKNGGA